MNLASNNRLEICLRFLTLVAIALAIAIIPVTSVSAQQSIDNGQPAGTATTKHLSRRMGVHLVHLVGTFSCFVWPGKDKGCRDQR
jgi:hypothetical protein